MIYDLEPDQSQLANLMSEISERCYSAAWMADLEYVLWDAVINGQRKYGHGVITQPDIDDLKKLSQACQAWIFFDDETEETAINLDTWTRMFEEAIIDNPGLLHH
jgi:hypothetical protein